MKCTQHDCEKTAEGTAVFDPARPTPYCSEHLSFLKEKYGTVIELYPKKKEAVKRTF